MVYPALVRPHVLYPVLGSLQYKEDTGLWAHSSMRVTKVVTGLKHRMFKEILKELGLVRMEKEGCGSYYRYLQQCTGRILNSIALCSLQPKLPPATAFFVSPSQSVSTRFPGSSRGVTSGTDASRAVNHARYMLTCLLVVNAAHWIDSDVLSTEGACYGACHVMAGPLLIIYQRSWESGEVPADWKLANVITIYKNGVREDQGTTNLLV
ncbi:hypothetical protein QYF61_021648 [Mycteria americana]|uniref:Uncharacterized protein n=1 Tax=Mycteria americana TaxID=33587 RepID=A0AAN7S1K2_MYCAM|nr:hypothetical protein QYF61_021648 [Mycteria americana]